MTDIARIYAGLPPEEQVTVLQDLIDGLAHPMSDVMQIMGLTMTQAIIFSVLKNNRGRIATRWALMTVADVESEDERNIDSQIKRMRPKVKRFGYVIDTHYGAGYSMRQTLDLKVNDLIAEATL